MVVNAPAYANKEVESSKLPYEVTPTHQGHSFERRRTTPRWNQTSRYVNRFNGYCFSCSNFGHKAMEYRSNGRRSAGSPNDKVRCWSYNSHVHIAANYHRMRCYSCSGFVHKAKEFPCQRSQPRESTSYTSTRKVYESSKKKDTGNFEGQRRNDDIQGHSKVWVRKNIILDLNEVDDKCKNEDGCHMAS